MSSGKNAEKSTDTALMSLNQLSDTIEAMTSVVKRLKHHLYLQLSLNEDASTASALSQELLENERELLGLQQLTNEQMLSLEEPTDEQLQEVLVSEMASTEELETLHEVRSFVIEIARDDPDDLAAERVLH